MNARTQYQIGATLLRVALGSMWIAHALLKLLEEPPADSHFLLTTEDANRLLPTIRSRLVPLRLGRLADAEVERFLGTHAGLAGTGSPT